MNSDVPDPAATMTATTNVKLSPAQMKLLLHLQMMQRQVGDGTMQVILHVTRGRIELIQSQPIQRIVFS